MGSEEPAPGAVDPFQRTASQGRKHSRLPAIELDRDGCVALHLLGKYSHRAALFCEGTRRGDPREYSFVTAERRAVDARRADAEGDVPDAFARMRAVHGSDLVASGYGNKDYRRDGFVP